MITYDKEIRDIRQLATLLLSDEWVDKDTILVCCSPDYSSIACQIINHALAGKTGSLLHQLYLESPLPLYTQVWNRDRGEYENYDNYLSYFLRTLDSTAKYLFVDIYLGKEKQRLLQLLRGNLSYKIASVYVDKDILPDYHVEITTPPTFEWQKI